MNDSTPSVAIILMAAGLVATRRIASRSTMTPYAVVRITAASAATGAGQPRLLARSVYTYAASMPKAAWAKESTPVERYMSVVLTAMSAYGPPATIPATAPSR